MSQFPRHIAIIPDGNRRWAKVRGLETRGGHEHGVSNFKKIATVAFEKGVLYVTFWALSIDNLERRSEQELRLLFGLIQESLEDKKFVESLLQNDIRLRVVGKWKTMIQDEKLKEAISNLEKKTEQCSKNVLTILLAYDGKTEMEEAIQNIEQPASRESLQKALWTGFLPPVDLVVRTGGEPHWSGGFMMWLVADSQLYFTETKWPDFDEAELDRALQCYSKSERRFGK